MAENKEVGFPYTLRLSLFAISQLDTCTSSSLLSVRSSVLMSRCERNIVVVSSANKYKSQDGGARCSAIDVQEEKRGPRMLP